MHTRGTRPWWRILGRSRCVCGLPWPCLEVRMAAIPQRDRHRPLPPVADPVPNVRR
jgi:hypothetical protein